MDDEVPCVGRSNIPERVHHPGRHEHGRTGRGRRLLVIESVLDLAFEDVERLVVRAMPMDEYRRTGREDGLEHPEALSSGLRGNLHVQAIRSEAKLAPLTGGDSEFFGISTHGYLLLPSPFRLSRVCRA